MRAALAALLLALAAPAMAAGEEHHLTLDTLVARYRLPASRFIDAGGVRVHYTDTGRGPVVLLLHGSYLNLRDWDDWVRVLGRDRRVIRIDRLHWGLTGDFPDAKIGYAREQALLDGFVKAMGLERFALVGSSSGGIVAAQYAERHPDQVERLILMNFPLGHARIGADGNAMAAETAARDKAGYQTEAYTRQLLDYNLVDRRGVTPARVRWMTDFSNRADPTGAAAGAFAAGASFTEADRTAMLGRINSPTLVMWSERNRTLSLPNGEAAFQAIGAKDKSFTLIRNAGHMVPIEAGAATARVAQDFLAGKRPPAEVVP